MKILQANIFGDEQKRDEPEHPVYAPFDAAVENGVGNYAQPQTVADVVGKNGTDDQNKRPHKVELRLAKDFFPVRV